MPNKSTATKSISLTPKTIEMAGRRIERLSRELGYRVTFSGYIEKLIREDLGGDKGATVSSDPGGPHDSVPSPLPASRKPKADPQVSAALKRVVVSGAGAIRRRAAKQKNKTISVSSE